MKLMTKEIEKKIPVLYAQDGKGMDAEVFVKFFNPTGHATWFITEYNPEERLMFGWCELHPGCGELGYVSLDELEAIKLPLGLGIERDLHFGKRTLREAIKQFTGKAVS